jgi:predicted nucleotidyltransferase
MANIFHDDFRDFLSALNKSDVRYVLIGGYSVVLHGYSRTTGDMDLWVERSAENYKKIKNAFDLFGMPVFDMTEDNFLSHLVWDVFTFGNPPVAIDIMIKLEGFQFDEVFKNAVIFEDDDLEVRTINKVDLIALKSKAGRPKDINDIQNL